MLKNKIIIWGGDDFNTLGLLREYGEAGADVFFLIRGPRAYASQSKYCINFKQVKSDEEGKRFLLDNFSNEERKPIIVTSGDGLAVYINQKKEELEKFFIIPGTEEKGLQEKYTDKNAMTRLAVELGILCPRSQFCQWNTDITNIVYPCLIKPAHQKPGHYNEFKFIICKSKSELKRTLKAVRHDSEFILQDCIQKEKDILVYGARMWNGNMILAGAMIRDRFADSGSASHGLMTSVIPDCVDKQKIGIFLDKINYHGLFSFEYGMVGDKAYFFEVNLRNDGTSHYFYQAGANIPLAYAYSCAGLDYSQIPTTVTDDKWFIDEVFDYENVIKGVVTQKQWRKEKEQATVFKYYAEDDKAPWLWVKKRRWRQTVQDLVLKRFRLYIIYVLDKLGLKK